MYCCLLLLARLLHARLLLARLLLARLLLARLLLWRLSSTARLLTTPGLPHKPLEAFRGDGPRQRPFLFAVTFGLTAALRLRVVHLSQSATDFASTTFAQSAQELCRDCRALATAFLVMNDVFFASLASARSLLARLARLARLASARSLLARLVRLVRLASISTKRRIF